MVPFEPAPKYDSNQILISSGDAAERRVITLNQQSDDILKDSPAEKAKAKKKLKESQKSPSNMASFKEKETAADSSMMHTGFAFNSFDASSAALRYSTINSSNKATLKYPRHQKSLLNNDSSTLVVERMRQSTIVP